MGKHDKQEEVKFSWQPMPDEYYKARIKTLEKKIEELEEELKEAQQNVAVMTHLYDHSAETVQRSEARSDEIIESKNEEIDMAKEAIYLAAMREVALRR